jgi:N-acetylmuramoyl-L-alanine amidase
MTKRVFTVVLFAVLLPFAFSFTIPVKQKKPFKTIIIDPGHGGKDQGAKGLTSTEAQICLEIGLKLGKAIEKNFPDINVLYTRTTDIIPGNKPDKNQGLRYRAEFANQSGADLFVAIHVNAAPRKVNRVPIGYRYVGKGSKRRKIRTYRTTYSPNPATGTETYIWAGDESGHKTDMIKLDEEFGENDSTIVIPEINDPVMKAFQLLYAKKFFNNSLQFANLIETEFANQGRVSRGVKQRNDVGIWVLHATGMPSVLVETGFISDKTEEEYLNSDKGQAEIVQNILDALKKYIAIVDKQSTGNNVNNKLPETKNTKADPALANRKDPSKLKN